MFSVLNKLRLKRLTEILASCSERLNGDSVTRGTYSEVACICEAHVYCRYQYKMAINIPISKLERFCLAVLASWKLEPGISVAPANAYKKQIAK